MFQKRNGRSTSTAQRRLLLPFSFVSFVAAFDSGLNHIVLTHKRGLSSTTCVPSSKNEVFEPWTVPVMKYVRWKTNEQADRVCWEMQTAVTIFERTIRCSSNSNKSNNDEIVIERLELHALLHYGDASYFDYFNRRQFNARHDMILYELLLDETLLTTSSRGGQQHSKNPTNPSWSFRYLLPGCDGQSPIFALTHDNEVAQQYGWKCQADVMNFSLPNWIHADLTRQELLKRMQYVKKDRGGPFASLFASSSTKSANSTPLWKQLMEVSPLTSVAAEAATALLVGPPLLTSASAAALQRTQQPPRRLFSNLFLTGGSLALVFRTLLWLTVPSPEISVLLLDWSSLLFGTDDVSHHNANDSLSPVSGRRRRPRGQVASLSPVGLPILQLLAQGRLDLVRPLVFGQVLVAGNPTVASQSSSLSEGTQSNQHWSLLITERNQRALQVLQQCLQMQSRSTSRSEYPQLSLIGLAEPASPVARRLALLYGYSHCPDLHIQIQQLGFIPSKTEWRTAWSVSMMTTAAFSSSSSAMPSAAGSNPNSAVVPLIPPIFIWLLPLYFFLGGLDWIACTGNLAEAVEAMFSSNNNQDALLFQVALDTILYLIRHVALYVALSKFVLDWGGGGASAIQHIESAEMFK